MKFIVKAVLQQVFNYLPRSESLNYFFQRNVTRSLPRSDESFLRKVEEANRHFTAFLHWCLDIKITDAHFFEFGAGWDLIIPLSYYCFGVQHQTIIDIRQNLRLELVNDTISRFLKHKSKLESILCRQLRVSPVEIGDTSELFDTFGIHWLAPIDAKDTHFPSESFDFISNTVTLEHIPENDIAKILKECYRILRPGGIMSCLVDLKDHYSYFDSTISYYNFLKFSDKTWAYLNSPIHFQNRLRYPDYINLITQSGFEIVDQDVERPSYADMEALKHLRLANRFKAKYSLEDLGVKSFWIILRKRKTGNGA